MSKIIMTVNNTKANSRTKNRMLATGIEPMDYYSEKNIGDFYVTSFLNAHTIEYNGERVHAITFINNLETGYTDLILKIESPHGLKELKLNKYAETLDYKFIQLKIELKKLAKNTKRVNENIRIFDFTNR